MKDILAVVGAITVVLAFIKLLFEVIPKLNSFRADAYSAISRKIRHKNLEKRAIASDIENVVNNSVAYFRSELPAGWVRRVRIQWVQSESSDDLEEGELILRMRPLENQDTNLMNGIYYFFTEALFPRVKEVIPRIPRKAAVLQLSRRAILRNHPYVTREFEKGYLDPAIKEEPDTAYYLGRYETLDQRGFFTSVFIREVADLADRVRYSEKRSQITDDLTAILEHIVTFIQSSPDAPDDDLWYRRSGTSSYGFLLVARPLSRRTEIYVKRANYHIQNNVSRLYVLGANQEKAFVKRVIKHIANRTRYTLVELFESNRDYRGEAGGICAIFDLTASQQQADRVIEEFFEAPEQG